LDWAIVTETLDQVLAAVPATPDDARVLAIIREPGRPATGVGTPPLRPGDPQLRVEATQNRRDLLGVLGTEIDLRDQGRAPQPQLPCFLA